MEKKSGDGHIKKIKGIVKRTFPDITGPVVKVQIGVTGDSEPSAIADDILHKRLAAGVPDKGNDAPALNVNGGASSGFVQAIQGIVNHWVGYLVIVNTEFEDGGKHVSNSGAVRVDNISEVIRVLEVLLKR